jgi:hypothetical protein
VPFVPLEPRLQGRFMKLVSSHCAATQDLASGIHALPLASSAWASTQAGWRFLKNPRISLNALATPLINLARQEVPRVCGRYVLVVHDWSQLMYKQHAAKTDRICLSSSQKPEGYELQSALLVSDQTGSPIAPAMMSLRAADGVHCTASSTVRQPLSPLDELEPAMGYVDQLSLQRPTVHIIDAEADSVAHFREWHLRPGRLFLVRADDRLVWHQNRELRCSELQADLQSRHAFRFARDVTYHGRAAKQFIAAVHVTLTRAGQRNRPKRGDRRRIPGPPLELRLIISEVRGPADELLATWFLLTNLPGDVQPATIALWYYWRWSIEKFHKLLKSAGTQVEEWQQRSAAKIARRLLIACMACVVVWHLDRNQDPQAGPARELLVRLSGRLVKRGKTHTMPSMLAGLWVLLAMLDTLEQHSIAELATLRELILAHPPPKATKDV